MNIVPLTAPRLVGDLMTAEPVVIRADAHLTDAAKLLDHHHIHGMAAGDGVGVLVGVITQTDLLRASATESLWANWAGQRVRHLMSSPALTIHQDQAIVMAARKMERHRVHRLVDETLPIGMVSTSDVVHVMSAYPSEDDAPGAAGPGVLGEGVE